MLQRLSFSQRYLHSSESRGSNFLWPSRQHQAVGFIGQHLLSWTGESLLLNYLRRRLKYWPWIQKTPAGDVPIRSITLAADGSCLVAGNNKVDCCTLSKNIPISSYRGNVTFGKWMTKIQGFRGSKLLPDSWHTESTSPAVCSVPMLGMLFLVCVEVDAGFNSKFHLDI
jgi:hypothetical protein